MKTKTRPQDQFQLIHESDMPFNLAWETLPPEPPPPIPCECGNPEASWHGDKLGYRTYCCSECWQYDPESNQVWITAAELNMNYSNE